IQLVVSIIGFLIIQTILIRWFIKEKKDDSPRSLHKLYKILYKKIKYKKELGSLCGCIYRMLYDKCITDVEYYKLLSHFKSQKPTEDLHSEFYYHFTYSGQQFWWRHTEST